MPYAQWYNQKWAANMRRLKDNAALMQGMVAMQPTVLLPRIKSVAVAYADYERMVAADVRIAALEAIEDRLPLPKLEVRDMSDSEEDYDRPNCDAESPSESEETPATGS